jgi:hypothetical protein
MACADAAPGPLVRHRARREVRIYELVPESDNWDTFLVELDAERPAWDYDVFLDGFKGESMADHWQPVPMDRQEQERATMGVPDFPLVANVVNTEIISERAAALLDPLIGRHIELLPMASDEGQFFAMNVVTVVDVLDEELSEGNWYGPGRMSVIRRFVMRSSADHALPPVFKIPQSGRTFITDEFLAAVREHGLTGLGPRPVGET